MSKIGLQDFKNISPTSSRVSSGTSPMNPYNNIDPNKSLSWWNRFTDSLGFTNHSGQLTQQYDLLSNQWESEYALALQDREYNSLQAQMERMREAGLNPDLNGGQNLTPGESGLANNEANSQVPVLNDQSAEMTNTLSTLGKAVQFVFSIVGGATNLGNQIAQTRRNSIDSDVAKVGDLFESGKDTLVSQLVTSLGLYGLSDEGILDDFLKGGTRFQNTATADTIFANLDYKIKDIINNSSLRTRKARKYALQRFKDYVNNDSFRRDVEKRIGENKDVRFNALNSASKLSALGATPESILDEMVDIGALYYKHLRNVQNTDITLNNARTKYANSIDVSAAAQAFDDENSLRSHNAKLQKAQTGFEKDTLEKLYKDYHEGKPGAGLLLFGYQLMKALTFNVGQKVDPRGNVTRTMSGGF